MVVEKASAAKQRKDRKKAKNDPTWRSKLTKDPGVPNLFPFKDKILKEIEDGKRRKEEEAAARREQSKAQRKSVIATRTSNGGIVVDGDDIDLEEDLMEDEDEDMDDQESSNPMAALLASARARAAIHDPANASDGDEMDEDDESDAGSFASFDQEPSSAKTTDNSRRAHAQTLNNLISTSDIILYILDARDPLATRSPAIEAQITSNPNKRLILILNKIDLVPANVLKGWLLYLRKSFPTLPLRSSTSTPAAKQFDHKHLTATTTATNLVRALKTYALTRASTTVGIVGYPNVGKSSVVNALTSRLSGKGPKAKKECPVGSEAGVTTSLREVKLDGKMRLVDSPGVVFATATGDEKKSTKRSAKDAEEEKATLVLLNALPPKEIGDPMPAVSLLLKRMGNSELLMGMLMDAYGLPALMKAGPSKDITTDFLLQVARKRGRIGKGGIPNLHAAAQTVISDWRDGRIQGWVEAPPEEESSSRSKDEKVIVTEWAKEFKIEGLWGDGADAEGDVRADGEDALMTA